MTKEHRAVPADEVIGKLPAERQARIKARAHELMVGEQRRSFANIDLTEPEVEAIAKACMAARHDHLDKLINEE